MAISLKNHDDRIKALESKIGSSTGAGVSIVESAKPVKSGYETRWYRKWSDGLIENFIVYDNTYNSHATNGIVITFAKPFTNTNYVGLKIDSWLSTTQSAYNYLHSKTTKNCQIVCNEKVYASVYCCGY